jgi:hypothetical protein
MTTDPQWLNSLSREEWKEIYDDACDAYATGRIDVTEFRLTLAKLGLNASDIEDDVKLQGPLE